MRILLFTAICLFQSLAYAGGPPEVIVHDGRFLNDGKILEVDLSYCGNEGNFEFYSSNCPSFAQGSGPYPNCVRIVPKYYYTEKCERVVKTTVQFHKDIDFTLQPPKATLNFFVLGDRESKVELKHPLAK